MTGGQLPITARLARGVEEPVHLATAVHEAAHVLVAAVLGATARRIEIRVDGTGSAFHDPLDLDDGLAALLAGQVAEHILDARPGEVIVECAWNDTSRARAVAVDHDPVNAERLLSRARFRADELLRLHWGGLERLANVLVDMWVLEGDLLDHLVQAALADAPDLVAGANVILARRTAEKRREAAVVERRLDFERRTATLRAEGRDTPEALAVAWHDAEQHAAVAAARAVPSRRVVIA